MSTEEKKSEQETASHNNGFKTKMLAFLKKNIVSIILLIAIIIVYIWFSAKMSSETNRYENEKTQLISKFKTERDSLQIKHLEFTSTIFSWSVRSELLRNNMENLSDLINVFVKESGANWVQLINSENNVVMLSSDKKFEGNHYNEKLDFDISKTVVLKKAGFVHIVIPITGINSKIAILVIELKTS
ncbi:MAG: hypothetical protein K9J13_16075 [Saprospiraceae bacterium]|nr:hypothetical protein [Saprospiraceae bacterium]